MIDLRTTRQIDATLAIGLGVLQLFQPEARVSTRRTRAGELVEITAAIRYARGE